MDDSVLREQLIALLRGGNAHMRLQEAVADFPMGDINKRPANVPYTFWHLLEHIRITQWDILDFIRNPDYVPRRWPEDYWPARNELANNACWDATIEGIKMNLSEFESLAKDTSVDLTAPIPHAAEYNLLREILLAADHNAYHLGEFCILRQIAGNWPKGHS